MKRAQSKVVNTPLLQRNELLYHINYLSSIKDTFYGGASIIIQRYYENPAYFNLGFF